MAKVLITGASGLIGKELSELLAKNGHTVVHLGRRENLQAKYPCYQWNIDNETIDSKAFDGVDSIIHLAGANISEGRWTTKRKAEIIDSRVKSMKMIIAELNKRPGQIKSFVGASAIGYYGALTSDTIFTEDMPPYHDFIAKVCKLWEESYAGINPDVRTTIIRIGVVMSNKGGALVKLAKPVKMGLGSALGSGKQYVPWIHLQDLIRLFSEAVNNEKFRGTYNAVATEHIDNIGLTRAIAQTLHKKLLLPPVPGLLLKLFLGEMSGIVLYGSRVSNEKLIAKGFEFKYPDIKSALKNLLT